MCSAETMKDTLTQQKVDLLQPSSKRYKVYDFRLAGFFVLVRPTGLKSYWCFLRVNGRGTDYKLGSCAELTLKQARVLGAAALVKAKGGLSAIEERRASKEETLQGFLEARYRAYLMANQRSAKTTLWILEEGFKEFMKLRLKDISISKVEKWRTAQTKKLKPSTMNRRTASLKAVLSTAKRWGIIDVNPLVDLSQMKVFKRPVEFLSDTQLEELRRVLGERDKKMFKARIEHNQWLLLRDKPTLPDHDLLECSTADYLTPLAILIMESGLRFSEAIELEWKDIDADGQSFVVHSGKTNSYRVCSMPSSAEFLLRQLKRLNKANCGRDTDRIFVASNGKPIIGVKTSWNGIRKKLDFACDWRMLRRTFGSRLIRQGVPVYTVSQMLGHSSIKTTEDWYITLDLESKRKAMQTLDSF
jgi:integrase